MNHHLVNLHFSEVRTFPCPVTVSLGSSIEGLVNFVGVKRANSSPQGVGRGEKLKPDKRNGASLERLLVSGSNSKFEGLVMQA